LVPPKLFLKKGEVRDIFGPLRIWGPGLDIPGDPKIIWRAAIFLSKGGA